MVTSLCSDTLEEGECTEGTGGVINCVLCEPDECGVCGGDGSSCARGKKQKKMDTHTTDKKK